MPIMTVFLAWLISEEWLRASRRRRQYGSWRIESPSPHPSPPGEGWGEGEPNASELSYQCVHSLLFLRISLSARLRKRQYRFQPNHLPESPENSRHFCILNLLPSHSTPWHGHCIRGGRTKRKTNYGEQDSLPIQARPVGPANQRRERS